MLEYLANFVEGTSGTPNSDGMPHPCQMVIDAFSDKATAALSCQKLHGFLEEALTAQGQRLVSASKPDTCFSSTSTYLEAVITIT